MFESSITFYPVSDLARTRQFYGERLGLTLKLDQGRCLIYQVSASGYFGFCECPGVEAQDASPIMTFVCQQVDEVFEEWSAQGVETEEAPKLNEKFQIYHFFARDPDGYRLEVQRFEDPRWG
ncbi:MAG: VOC family protein [Fimbriimonadaceae bacterium]